MTLISRFFLCALLFLMSFTLNAHQLAPALLGLQQTSEYDVDVRWKESVIRPNGAVVAPIFADNCKKTDEPQIIEEEMAMIYLWRVHCEKALAGQQIRFVDLEKAKTNILIAYSNTQGQKATQLVSASDPVFEIPLAVTPISTFGKYLVSGIEHLLFGWDHVAFVIGLFALLLGRYKSLLWAVTAFTVGHSVTLIMASYQLIPFNPQWVEALIAASILVLAIELLAELRDWPWSVRQKPFVLTFAFGLIHGCGFASVLADVLSDEDSLLVPLLAFNLGIELGQLLLIAVMAFLVVLALTAMRALAAEKQQRLVHKGRLVLCYYLGTISVYWLLNRIIG